MDSSASINAIDSHAAQILGVQAEVAVGKTLPDLLAPKSSKMIRDEIQHYQDTGASDFFNSAHEVSRQTAAGAEWPLQLAFRVMEFNDQDLIVGLAFEIAQQNMRIPGDQQHKSRLKSLAKYSPSGVTILDINLCVREANTAFTQLLGYQLDDLVGKPIADFIHSSDIEDVNRAAQAALANATDSFVIRKRFIHKNGNTVFAPLIASVQINKIDDHENVNAVHTPRASTAIIESMRTEQRERLIRLDRLSMLGEMTAGIAHEINQPLTAISTYAKSCQHFTNPANPNPELLNEVLVKLGEQARRAGAVVARIRAFAHQPTAKNVPVDCNQLLEALVELAEHEVSMRGAILCTDLEPNLPSVLCDPVQIQQVTLNLIRNALDSMESDGFSRGNSIILQTTKFDSESVRIAVSDTGIGVNDILAKRLLQPFSTNKKAGIGLGLSISKSIVEAHGGCLDYYNNDVGGATFYFTLRVD